MTTAKRALLAIVGLVLLAASSFVYEGTNESWRKPDFGVTGHPVSTSTVPRVRVLAYNIAKCGAYSGSTFHPPQMIERCLDEVATVIANANPDLVFLSEVVKECGPCPVDQVGYLADRLKMHAWAFGANFSWGVPLYRIRAGNAVLSRHPLTAVEVQPLSGDAPFYEPTNQRRALWTEVTIRGKTYVAGAIRNDSFSLANNHVHAQEILRRLDRVPAFLGGDFNAEAHDDSMKAFMGSGLFIGEMNGPKSFPSDDPIRTIDFVLAPSSFDLVEHHVFRTDVSDHLPVFSVFAEP